MAASTKAKVGRPRLDPGERLIHRFYEPVIMMSVLGRTQENHGLDATSRPESQRFTISWRRFLDALSILCDYEPGGRTVSAIAAQETPNHGPRFLLAAPKSRAMGLLIRVLQTLGTVSESPKSRLAILEQQIVKDAIDLCKKKVENRARILSQSIEKALEILSLQPSMRNSALSESLCSFLNTSDTLELCQLAFDFRGLAKIESMSTGAFKPDPDQIWSKLRHTIGRLGSWHRAVRSLVAFARQFPQVLSNFGVKYVVIPAGVDAPQADAKTNIESAIKRMLPPGSESRVKSLYATLESSRCINVSEEFLKRFTEGGLKPRVHAEVALLDYICSRDFSFFMDERYIGCSKPSCYCCDLYFRYHYSNVGLRPCHGNLYDSWSPPTPLREADGTVRNDIRDILNLMNKHIRRDLISQIEAKCSKKTWGPDSVTEVSCYDFQLVE